MAETIAADRRMYPYAIQTARAQPRQDAALYEHFGADARARHRCQYRDLQRHPRRAPEATAISALRRARDARPCRARCQHPTRRRRAVSLLHVSRGRPGVPGCRPLDHRHRERHRPRGARGSAGPVRDRRRAAHARRPADARPHVLENRRLASKSGNGRADIGILAIEIRR